MKTTPKRKEWEKGYSTQVVYLEEIKQNKALLRFGKNYIKNSEVSGQIYRERQVELKCIDGEVETEQSILGRESHEERVKDSEKISPKEGWEKIFTSSYFWVSESLFFAKYRDVYFVFKPDSVLFVRGIPRLLIEFKFSKYFNREPFRSQEVQLQNEGLFLNTLGFETSSLLYSIIIAPLSIEQESTLLNKIPTMIYKKIEGYKLGYPTSFNDINGTNISAYVYQFELDTAKKNVDWALQYWKEEREAELTKNINKCRSCHYISGCERKNIIAIQS